MNIRKSLVSNIIFIAIGGILFALSSFNKLDSIYSGFGAGLFVCGIVQLIRAIRYKTNEAYKNTIDTELSDERNRYINQKAWAWAGYLFVIILAIITIVCMILKQTLYMELAGFTICLILILYWISYLVLRKKY